MISLLLIVPLVSLFALYAYSAYSAVGNALARQNEQQLSKDLGAPVTALYVALDTERADGLLYLVNQQALMTVPGHQATPLATFQAAESATDKAVAGFKSANASAAGLEPPSGRSLLSTVVADLNTLPGLRKQIMNGQISLLSALDAYNNIYAPMSAFSTGFFDSDAPIPLFEQSNAVLQEGEATTSIAEQAALIGAVAATGGNMTAQEHLAFAQAVAQEKQDEAEGSAAIDWQESPDPYPAFWRTPVFQSFEKAQTAIDTASPGVLPSNALQAWNKVISPVIAQETATTGQAQVGVTQGQNHQGNVILEELILVGGVGLFAVFLSALLLLRFGNRITRELTSLRAAARMLAGERLPIIVDRLRAGEDLDADVEAKPLALRTRTREVTETAEAFSVVQHTAVQAAVDQATLRKGVSSVFRSLARRNHSLLQRQLKMLDGMERNTQDPDQLAQLFQLDHLTTRMRRQAEGLIILSGASPGRGWRQPVPVVEVLRGAISEIEDYARVDLLTDSPDFIQGTAVADVTHLLAELIENAVLYSPPTARVQVRGSRAANGYVVEVEDRGLGIQPEDRATLNERLVRPPEFDIADSDQLGLFVVARLSLRHDIRVSLRESGSGGTTAIVLLPAPLVVSEDEAAMIAQHGPAAIGSGPEGNEHAGNGRVPDGRGDDGFAQQIPSPFPGNGDAPGRRRRAIPTPALGTAAAALEQGSVRTMPLRGDRAPGNGRPPFGDRPPSSNRPPSGERPPFDDRPPFEVAGGGAGNGFGDGVSGGLSGGFGDRASGDAGNSTGNGMSGFGAPPGPGGSGGPAGPPSFESPAGLGGAAGEEPLVYPRRKPGASGAGAGFASQGGLAGPGSGAGPGYGGPGPAGAAGPAPVSGFGDNGPSGFPADSRADSPAGPRLDSRAAAGDGGGQSSGTTSSGLPRRDKGANIAPQLRDSPREQPRGPLSDRSPEQARALLSNIQRGLRSGRNTSLPKNDNGTSGEEQQ